MRGINKLITNTLSVHDRGEWLKMLFASIFLPILSSTFEVHHIRAPPFLSELTYKSIRKDEMMKEQNSYIFTKEVKSLDSFSLGQRIQDARICKGIKAIDLSELLELSKDQYSRIENGRSVCSTEKLYLISQYLNTSADYLLSGNKSEDILHQLSVMLDGKGEKELERARRVLEAVFM